MKIGPVLVSALCLLVYGVAVHLNGSGFLAVYLAGVVLSLIFLKRCFLPALLALAEGCDQTAVRVVVQHVDLPGSAGQQPGSGEGTVQFAVQRQRPGHQQLSRSFGELHGFKLHPLLLGAFEGLGQFRILAA